MLSNLKKSDKADVKGNGRTAKVPASLTEVRNAPTALLDSGADAFAEIYGKAMVSSHRMFVITVIALVVAAAAVISVMLLLPLKQVQSWVVEVDSTGVVHKPVEVIKISPSRAVIASEIKRWVEAVYAIDPYETSKLYKYANARARDKAVDQFADFRAREKTFERIATEPRLVREVKVSSVDVNSQPGLGFVFVETLERGGSATGPTWKQYRLSIHYLLESPTNMEALLENPLGLFVTNFVESLEQSR